MQILVVNLAANVINIFFLYYKRRDETSLIGDDYISNVNAIG